MPIAKVDTRTDEQRAAHNLRMKRYYANHPEQRQKTIASIKQKYASDPEYRAKVLARSLLQRQAKALAATAVAEEVCGCDLREEAVVNSAVSLII